MACEIAKEVASEGDAIVCGSLSPVPEYRMGKEEAVVRREFSKQLDTFIKYEVDFVLAEVRSLFIYNLLA